MYIRLLTGIVVKEVEYIMISFENVSKFILSDVSIHIPEGITLGLIGATGSGKTTFVKLCCGLLEADRSEREYKKRGRVYVMGHEPVLMAGKRVFDIGVLFADIPLFNAEGSILDNYDNLRHIYRLNKKYFDDEYERISRELDFKELKDYKVSELSLGQRRRAELGAVLIHNPRLLILDEPSIGLDQNGKNVLRRLIKERAKAGLTTIVTSHDMADITEVCDRICILDKGSICYYGSKELLLKKYAPIDVMNITLIDKMPDIQDLPVESYCIEGELLKLIYNSNHITSAEILKVILQQVPIREVSIHKPDLTDVIMRIERGITDEQFY